MGTNGHLTKQKVIQLASAPLRGTDLKDEAQRLVREYLETFRQAPESDFLLKRYFFARHHEKEHLQDNVLFIPRADFLWFFKYYQTNKQVERVIELTKRSTERAETELEIATVQTRRYYAVEEHPADIIYTRKASDKAEEAFMLINTTGAVTRLEQLLVDFRNDRVMRQAY